MSDLIETWTTRPEEEAFMAHEHDWIWRHMIRATAPFDPGGAKVLDVGCNQGRFLRLLHDTRPMAEGVGVDLAKQAVEIAEAAKGDRPLRYLATPRLADAGAGFDIAYSHEVIYLIDDLADHAAQVAGVLKPGGCYFAVTCCHRDNPLWPVWRADIQQFSNVPVPDHSVADIADAFRAAGFDVSISRFLADAFIPDTGPSPYFPTALDRIDVYANWKLMFRFTRPA